MAMMREVLKFPSGLQRWFTDKSDENAGLVVIVSVATTAVVVVLLHWLQGSGLSSGNIVLAALPVGVADIVAVSFWAFLLWLFWQMRLYPNQNRYALAAVLSVVMICVSLEAFAGLNTFLWKYGTMRSATFNPSLWRTEGHYLWHLVGSVPLLSIPRTLGWRDPQPLGDHLSGALLLAFKIAIIGPLVRLGLSGYQFFEMRRVQVVAKREIAREQKLAKEARRQQERGKKPLARKLRMGEDWWWPLTAVVLALIFTIPTMILADKGSWMDHWLARLPPSVSIGGVHLALNWLHAVPELLAVIGIIAIIGNLIPTLREDANPDMVRSVPTAAVAILTYFLVLVLIAFAAAAISLVLLHLNVAVSRPRIPRGSRPLAAVNTYAWSIADALPGPNIPATLNWTLKYRLVDHWSEVLLLIFKIGFLGVLLFPVYRIVRVYAERSRRAIPVEPCLSAACSFRDRLLDIQAVLDQLEGRQVSAARQRELGSSRYHVKLVLNDLDSDLEKVRLLFGDSEVALKATDAKDAADERYERSTRMSYGGGFTSRSIELERLRMVLYQSISEYSQKVAEVLHKEADKQLYRTRN